MLGCLPGSLTISWLILESMRRAGIASMLGQPAYLRRGSGRRAGSG